MQLARLISPDHLEKRTQEEVDTVLDFMAGGRIALAVRSRDDDIVSGERFVVPIVFKCDGEWIWSAAIGYYLRRHGTAIDPAFLEHIKTRPRVAAERVTNDQIREAIAMLRAEGVWPRR